MVLFDFLKPKKSEKELLFEKMNKDVSSPDFRVNQKYNFYNFIGTSSKGVL